jgi:hypothetical protein
MAGSCSQKSLVLERSIAGAVKVNARLASSEKDIPAGA